MVYILVFYNISFSWLLPLDGFQCIFSLRDSANDLLKGELKSGSLRHTENKKATRMDKPAAAFGKT